MGEPQFRTPPHLGRRRFLSLSAATLTGLVAVACGGGDALPGVTPAASPRTQPTGGAGQPTAATGQPTSAAQPAPAATQAGAAAPNPTGGAAVTGNRPTQFKEAPQLAEQVRAGRLPAVEGRLPKNPLVIQPVERAGRYGGTWRAATTGPADSVWLSRTVGWENILRWDIKWEQIIPNIAESFERNADATEFTFKLREGMKWSDGAPVTADDIMFWWEDQTLNRELSPGGAPLFMRPGNKVGTVEKVDQYTVRVKFEQPNGLFLLNNASGGIGITPKHYLQQFHKKYNPDNVDRLAREAGLENWVRLYQTRGSSIPGQPYDAAWFNPERPTLNPWRLVNGYADSPGRIVFERNPYYFKVDSEGNQLPYIDRVVHEVIEDREVIVLKALNGEIDMQDRHINALSNKAVFVDNQGRGQYRFFELVPSNMNQAAITLNLTHKDPVKRQIFQNKDFRIGLSHAINRQEIIDVVFVGQGEPWQLAPRRETPWFNERLAKQYTEFDLNRANQALDRAFPQKNAQGLRLGPDGQPIAFVVECTSATPSAEGIVDAMQLVSQHWRRVGVEAQVKAIDRSLLYNRKGANEHDCVVWAGDGGLKDGLVEMRYYFPFSFESNFAQAWTAWYNPGGNPRTQAEEPPEATRRQMELYERIKGTPGEAEQIELVKQILAIAQEQFYCMGVALPPNGYGLVKNNVKNVPEKMFFTGGPWLNPAATNPSQYFFEQR
jgi:peptide/nickel transport system substrate-binding protein